MGYSKFKDIEIDELINTGVLDYGCDLKLTIVDLKLYLNHEPVHDIYKLAEELDMDAKDGVLDRLNGYTNEQEETEDE